jgi:hypothetical protein
MGRGCVVGLMGWPPVIGAEKEAPFALEMDWVTAYPYSMESTSSATTYGEDSHGEPCLKGSPLGHRFRLSFSPTNRKLQNVGTLESPPGGHPQPHRGGGGVFSRVQWRLSFSRVSW